MTDKFVRGMEAVWVRTAREIARRLESGQIPDLGDYVDKLDVAIGVWPDAAEINGVGLEVIKEGKDGFYTDMNLQGGHAEPEAAEKAVSVKASGIPCSNRQDAQAMKAKAAKRVN